MEMDKLTFPVIFTSTCDMIWDNEDYATWINLFLEKWKIISLSSWVLLQNATQAFEKSFGKLQK